MKAQYHRLKSKFQQNCIKKSLKTEAFKIQLVKDLLVILFALSPQQTKETYGRECKVRFWSNMLIIIPWGEVNSGGYILIREMSRYISSIFIDPVGDSCFSIYQISLIKLKKKATFCKLKPSLSGNFVYNLQTFGGFCQVQMVANSA